MEKGAGEGEWQGVGEGLLLSKQTRCPAREQQQSNRIALKYAWTWTSIKNAGRVLLPPLSLSFSAASIDARYVARNFQFRPAAEFIKLLRSLRCLPSGHRLWHNLCVENEIMRPLYTAASLQQQFPIPCSDLCLPPPSPWHSSLTVVRQTYQSKHKSNCKPQWGKAYKKVGVAAWGYS